MSDLCVRPLGDNEDAHWFTAAPPGPARDGSQEVARERLAARSQADPRSFLLAWRGEEAVARLRGVLRSPPLFVVHEFHVREAEQADAAARAFAEYLRPSIQEEEGALLSLEDPARTAFNAALLQRGFVLDKQKVFVERSLADLAATVEPSCTYRSLVEIGERTFVDVMTKAALGDPFEDVADRDAQSDFRELVAYAGTCFDARTWKVAYIDGVAAGVLLPQVYEGSPHEGTLFYVGVCPDFRGRGLGTHLHAQGLSDLAACGVTHYVGSTDTRNVPMMRVFERNDCRQTGTQLFYKTS